MCMAVHVVRQQKQDWMKLSLQRLRKSPVLYLFWGADPGRSYGLGDPLKIMERRGVGKLANDIHGVGSIAPFASFPLHPPDCLVTHSCLKMFHYFHQGGRHLCHEYQKCQNCHGLNCICRWWPSQFHWSLQSRRRKEIAVYCCHPCPFLLILPLRNFCSFHVNWKFQ